MTRFTWNDSYRIGHPEMDAEHQELFHRVNTFLQARDKTSRMTILRWSGAAMYAAKAAARNKIRFHNLAEAPGATQVPV